MFWALNSDRFEWGIMDSILSVFVIPYLTNAKTMI